MNISGFFIYMTISNGSQYIPVLKNNIIGTLYVVVVIYIYIVVVLINYYSSNDTK